MTKHQLTAIGLKSLALAGAIFFAGCRKNDDPAPQPFQASLYVLNEGLFNMNNTTLTGIDTLTGVAKTDYFEQKNKRGLGDTGNDLKIYGSKMYAVVNVSSQLEVIDPNTGKSLKQISMLDEQGVPRQPRYIAFHAGKAYVCSFDGTVGRLDTATLQFDKFVKAGRQPDGICVANNKLYVSNSGGLDFPNYDNTVSVIDIPSFTELKKISVQVNPYTIQADDYGDVYVVSRGDYGDIHCTFQAIDSKTDQVKKVFEGLEVLNFTINGDLAYLYNYNFTTQQASFKLLNVKTEEIVTENFITDETKITTPYGIDVNPSNGDVYITDVYDFTTTGDVYCFSKEGKLKFKFQAGLNPNNVVFVQKPKKQ
ncbi:YncE family protein [Solitalea lacus]|uniref:YncE family protein n=1 Tax=Solitalea lacus TaxID=2911172 RepID=UPI001EDB7F24|nr:DUF5074 domain-containing protein [Solitalea lacus]UKJ08314.1 YncE family protein [Solitalea lacus]